MVFNEHLKKLPTVFSVAESQGEWIRALDLNRTVATGFRKAWGHDWSEQRQTKGMFSS